MAPSKSPAAALARKSDRTREAILDAARIAFARKGFSGVTIRDITALSGVTRANFYYYFPDKTNLFIALGTVTYREAMEVVESFAEPGDRSLQATIRDWVDVYFDHLDRNGAFIIRSADDAPQDPDFRAGVTRSYRRTATALGDRLTKIATSSLRADSFAVGMAVMAMLERTWLMTHHDEIVLSRDSVSEALSELISRMVD